MRTMQIKNGNYWFLLEGEWQIITQETIKELGPEMAKKVLRIYDADRKSQERETRCRKADGTRCMSKCSECPEYRSGTPLSLEELAEDGFEPVYPVSVEEQVLKNELYQALYSAINSLEKKNRLIIVLYFFEDKTERQIADLLHFSQKGINDRKAKALKKMQKLLKDFQ